MYNVFGNVHRTNSGSFSIQHEMIGFIKRGVFTVRYELNIEYNLG